MGERAAPALAGSIAVENYSRVVRCIAEHRMLLE
jgi:hypothetical protein